MAYSEGINKALHSTVIRNYLASHCSATDGVADARFLDDDLTDADFGYAKPWLEDYKKAKADYGNKVPWVLINRSVSVPMPANDVEFLALLKKYGGE